MYGILQRYIKVATPRRPPLRTGIFYLSIFIPIDSLQNILKNRVGILKSYDKGQLSGNMR